MANHKTELQFYVECIEEKLETFSSQQRFSLAYCARTQKISTFIELVFADQGFQILSIDANKLYAEDYSVAKLAEAIGNLKIQCLELDKPVIMLHNAHTWAHNEDDHNLLISILRDGLLVEKEPENDFIPVILTSTRSFGSTYSDHLNQVLNFNHMMVEKNQRVKKIWEAIETDELLAALQDEPMKLEHSGKKYPVVDGNFDMSLTKIPPISAYEKHNSEISHFSDKSFSIMDTSGSMGEVKDIYSHIDHTHEALKNKLTSIFTDDLKKAAEKLVNPVGFKAVEKKIQQMKEHNNNNNYDLDYFEQDSLKKKLS